MKQRLIVLLSLFALSLSFETQAYPVADTHTHTSSDSELCLNAIAKAEFSHNIPQQLLAGIARVESGKFDPVSKAVRPWPWVLGVKGRGEYFTNKEATLKRMKVLIGQGVKNFDVGCTQLNWQHQGKHFKSPEHMLEPVSNTHRAAQFLTELKRDLKAWSTAVGGYHNRTNKTRSQNYAKKVYVAWAQEKNAAYQDRRRAMAKANTPLTKKAS